MMLVSNSVEWPLLRDGPAPVDIALRADRLGLLWSAPPRVELRDLTGTLLADWPLPDRPRALALDQDGLPWVLDRRLGLGRWMRRAPWPAGFPAPAGRNAVDLAMSPEGLAYVAYARLSPMEPEGAEVLAAGIQVLRPVLAGAPPGPVGPACTVLVDRRPHRGRCCWGRRWRCGWISAATAQRARRPGGGTHPGGPQPQHVLGVAWSRRDGRCWRSSTTWGRRTSPIALMGFGDDPTLLAPLASTARR